LRRAKGERVQEVGKFLVAAGLLTAVLGLALMLVGKLPGGMLPGDILVERKNFTFFFPIATSIVVSIVLTLVVNFFLRR
jgi:hypothetical protein